MELLCEYQSWRRFWVGYIWAFRFSPTVQSGLRLLQVFFDTELWNTCGTHPPSIKIMHRLFIDAALFGKFSGLQSDRCPTHSICEEENASSSSKQKCDVIINHLQRWNLLDAALPQPCMLVPHLLDFSLLELYSCCDLLLQIEDIVTLIQDETEGVPIRTVKSFMTKIPSVVTGKTLSPLSPPLYQTIKPFTDLNILHKQGMSHSSWENGCREKPQVSDVGGVVLSACWVFVTV